MNYRCRNTCLVAIILTFAFNNIQAENIVTCDIKHSREISAGYAIPRLSPISYYETNDLSKAGAVKVVHSVFYRIRNYNDNFVKLCIGKNEYIVKRAHVYITPVVRNSVARKNILNKDLRPNIKFWEGFNKLTSYYSGYLNQENQPAYTELNRHTYKSDIVLPVIEYNRVESKFAERQLKATKVVIPIYKDSVNKYNDIFTPRRLTKNSNIILLVDISGSTKGFVSPAISKFHKQNLKWDLYFNKIKLYRFYNTENINGPRILSSKKLNSLKWHHKTTDHLNTEVALRRLFETILDEGGTDINTPIIVFADGDIRLPIADDRIFDNLYIVKITPEVKKSLYKSIPKRVKKIKYYGFDDDSVKSLFNDIDKDFKIFNNQLVTEEQLLPALNVFYENNIMPILPEDYSRKSQLVESLPPYINNNTEWFTIPLWVLNDGDIVSLEIDKTTKHKKYFQFY